MVWKDGFELQFGTNHLGHFLLTTLLEKSLLAGREQSGENSRVIVVASRAHYKGKQPNLSVLSTVRFTLSFSIGSMDWENLQGEKSYTPNTFYRQSKLANVLFANYLSK